MNPDSQTKISVIIPTFNRADTIISCVESVLNQTYPANEIIIVDDNSNDGTIARLNKFNDKIIIIHRKSQVGAQEARNIGIKAAKSEWIAFLDSDDEWLPNKLERQVSELNKVDLNSFTVVHGDCFKINIASGKKEVWNLAKVDGENVYSQLLTHSGTLFPSILTSKKALEKINFLDNNVYSYQEWDTAIRLAKFCRFIHIQEPLFIYSVQSSSISNDSELSIRGYQFIINKFKIDIINFCGVDIYYKHLLLNAIMALNEKNNQFAREILSQINKFNIKKILLLMLSYLGIRPKYYISAIQSLSREA